MSNTRVPPEQRKVRDMKAEARELLRRYPNGLTDKAIAKRLTIKRSLSDVSHLLETMGDAYIARWEPGTPKFPWRPVWRIVDVPPHCPRPATKEATR